MKKLIAFLIVMIAIEACNSVSNPAGKPSAKIQPSADSSKLISIKMKTVDSSVCTNIAVKNIEFFIEHEDGIDLSQYRLCILSSGIIYLGEFRDHIRVHTPCCMDSGLWVDVLTFSIWNGQDNIMYWWNKKESHPLCSMKKVRIKLCSNGEYKIKPDNEWFFQ